jgi:uncharacterized membrane protein YhaH (DUF805 family)
MNFSESIELGYKKYSDFEGRATRSEFWYFALFASVLSVIVSSIYFSNFQGNSGAGGLFFIIQLFGITIPHLSVMTRRLHDTNRSGWWYLIVLTVIGIPILFYWLCQKGGSNKKVINKKRAVRSQDIKLKFSETQIALIFVVFSLVVIWLVLPTKGYKIATFLPSSSNNQVSDINNNELVKKCKLENLPPQNYIFFNRENVPQIIQSIHNLKSVDLKNANPLFSYSPTISFQNNNQFGINALKLGFIKSSKNQKPCSNSLQDYEAIITCNAGQVISSNSYGTATCDIEFKNFINTHSSCVVAVSIAYTNALDLAEKINPLGICETN